MQFLNTLSTVTIVLAGLTSAFSSSSNSTSSSSSAGGDCIVPGMTSLPSGGDVKDGGEITVYTEWNNGKHTCVDYGLPAPLSGNCYAAMASGSWSKDKCGKSVLIEYQGKVARIKISDKCEGCKPNDLDLTVPAFKALTGGQDTGRFKMKWKWEN